MIDLEGRIADVIAEFVRDGGPVRVSEIAAAIQAELVRASTVTTEAELNALPAKTVIHDRDGEVFVYEDELERGWFYPGDDDPLPSRMIDLPATVLFRPV